MALKPLLFVFVLCVGIMLTESVSEQVIKDDLDKLLDKFLNEDVSNEQPVKLPKAEKPEQKVDSDSGGYPEFHDECLDKKCGHGRECDLNSEGKAICVCRKTCPPPELGGVTKVCSTFNETFPTECDLDVARCQCEERLPSCTNGKHVDAHLDYYGACKELEPCEWDDLQSMPERLREWFFVVMEKLAEQSRISVDAINLFRVEREKPNHWALPVMWKFCDLDSEPRDKLVSRRELMPLSAPLKPMEHCLGTFLDNCDVDKDRSISIAEWGACIGLTTEEIKQWENLCDSISVVHP